jgi:hypothetical protein
MPKDHIITQTWSNIYSNASEMDRVGLPTSLHSGWEYHAEFPIEIAMLDEEDRVGTPGRETGPYCGP